MVLLVLLKSSSMLLYFLSFLSFFLSLLLITFIRGEITGNEGEEEEGVPPKEAAMMRSLNHPHLLKCFGWGKVFRVELKAKKLEKLCCFNGGW